MKYYLATVDGKRTLYPWEKDIPKGVKAEEVELPTDKMGLMNLFQQALSEVDELKLQLFLKEIPEADEEFFKEATLRPMKPEGNASDGLPVVRPNWTSQQVNAMFKQRSEHVQDLCYHVSKLKPEDLAYVAFQVAAQITKPIIINISNPEE